MTNPNIPTEIADATPAPAPAPVRISPEVRETLLTALRESVHDEWSDLSSFQIKQAIAFVEALP